MVKLAGFSITGLAYIGSWLVLAEFKSTIRTFARYAGSAFFVAIKDKQFKP